MSEEPKIPLMLPLSLAVMLVLGAAAVVPVALERLGANEHAQQWSEFEDQTDQSMARGIAEAEAIRSAR